jgi:ribosomal protein L14E/L6E/L27E
MGVHIEIGAVVEIVRGKYVGQCTVVCKVMAQMCAVKLIPSNVEVRVMKTSI